MTFESLLRFSSLHHQFVEKLGLARDYTYDLTRFSKVRRTDEMGCLHIITLWIRMISGQNNNDKLLLPETPMNK